MHVKPQPAQRRVHRFLLAILRTVLWALQPSPYQGTPREIPRQRVLMSVRCPF
jgi:hypothetical protein